MPATLNSARYIHILRIFTKNFTSILHQKLLLRLWRCGWCEKTDNFMKKIVTLLLLIQNIINAQGLILKIDPLRQNNPNLCWAACTEMVDKFHSDTATQCNLGAIKFSTLLRRSFNCYTDGNAISVARFTKKSFSREFSSILQKGTNLYATEDSISLTFDFVKNQLVNCKPFILNLSMPYHALTVKGYITFKDSTRWLIVNDPNFNGAKEKYMYFDSLNVIDKIHYKYSSLVYDIHPKIVESCDNNCNDKPIKILEESELISSQVKDKISENITILPVFEILSYEKLQNMNNHLSMISHTSSYGDFLEKRFSLKYFNYDGITHEIQQFGQNKWAIVFFYKNTIPDEVTISGQNNRQINFKPNDILKYPLFNLEFYKLTDNNDTYFVPVVDYPSLELKANTIYSEKTLLKTLMKLKNSQ